MNERTCRDCGEPVSSVQMDPRCQPCARTYWAAKFASGEARVIPWEELDAARTES